MGRNELNLPKPAPPVRILQQPEEIAGLVSLYKSKKPKYVLEIGSFTGGTLWYWIKLAQPGAKIVSVDLMIQDGQRHEQEKGRREWSNWIEGIDCEFSSHLCSTTSPLFPKIVKREFPEGIDFAFVDGGHSYEVVQNDFAVIWQNLREGGLIALHDIHTLSKDNDCAKFWEALRNSGGLEHYLEIGTNYGSPEGGLGWGIGVVFK